MTKLFCLFLTFLNLHLVYGKAPDTIRVTNFGLKPNSFEDASAPVQKAIEACKRRNNVVLCFPKGRYDFWPQQAVHKAYFVSNTSSADEVPDKTKVIGLFFENLTALTIDGNGSQFIFHGKMTPWVMDHCSNVILQNLTTDFERPTMSEMKFLKLSPDSIIVSIHPDSKFAIIDQKLMWYGEGWGMKNFHAILVKPSTGIYNYSTWEPFLKGKAELLSQNKVKFYGDFSKFSAEPGDILTVRDPVRDQVGAFINCSKNIYLKNLAVRYMHGLGIVSQFSENLFFDRIQIAPDLKSGRVISCFADAVHFSGCKGDVVVENSSFKGLHDDPINIHGTHLKISQVLSPTKVRVEFMHPQTYGFGAFFARDSIAFVHSQSLQIFGKGVVKKADLVSEKEMEIELTEPLLTDKMVGDCFENLTWTPTATIRNCRFEGVNTRGLLVSTRRKVLIENNTFYRTGMYAILISNDASGWYESGEVQDVTIRNNTFEECAYNTSPDSYAIAIAPEDHQPAKGYLVHKNIRIENNKFRLLGSPAVTARSVDKLLFNNNIIYCTQFLPGAATKISFKLDGCADVQVLKNKFHTTWKPVIKLQDMTSKQVKTDIEIKN